MALPFNFANNPLVGANPLTPTYPTTGGPLPEFRTTGGPLPMATGGMQPMATGMQPMATGTTGYTLQNYSALGSNPFAFSRPDRFIGSGRDKTLSSYFSDIGSPQTQTIGYGGNQYEITFGPGMTANQADRLMTSFAGYSPEGQIQRVFNPSDALRNYYSYQNDLARLQAEVDSGQRSAAGRLDRFIDRNLPEYTVNFIPGTEGAVNPYLRTTLPGNSPRRTAGLLG